MIKNMNDKEFENQCISDGYYMMSCICKRQSQEIQEDLMNYEPSFEKQGFEITLKDVTYQLILELKKVSEKNNMDEKWIPMTKRVDVERFIYYPNSQMMIDNLTGEHYSANSKVCKLCNKLNRKADMNVELFDDYYKVLDKYGIGSAEKLDQVLMNERVW